MSIYFIRHLKFYTEKYIWGRNVLRILISCNVASNILFWEMFLIKNVCLSSRIIVIAMIRCNVVMVWLSVTPLGDKSYCFTVLFSFSRAGEQNSVGAWRWWRYWSEGRVEGGSGSIGRGTLSICTIENIIDNYGNI